MPQFPSTQNRALPGTDPCFTQQHVSSWENTGHKDWKAATLAKEVAKTLHGAEDAQWSEPLSDTAENLARWLISKLVVRLTELESAEPQPADYWDQITEIANALNQLRKGNHENQWLRLAKTRVSIAEVKERTRRENTSLEVQAVRELAGLPPT